METQKGQQFSLKLRLLELLREDDIRCGSGQINKEEECTNQRKGGKFSAENAGMEM